LESRRRRTFILWSLTSIALQFGYYGANTWLPSYLVSDLKVNPQSMGWYVAGTYPMMVLESHHWLPRRHRRTPRDVDCVGDVDGDLAADSDLHCNWLASSYFNGSTATSSLEVHGLRVLPAAAAPDTALPRPAPGTRVRGGRLSCYLSCP
jgi:hypothetical protein